MISSVFFPLRKLYAFCYPEDKSSNIEERQSTTAYRFVTETAGMVLSSTYTTIQSVCGHVKNGCFSYLSLSPDKKNPSEAPLIAKTVLNQEDAVVAPSKEKKISTNRGSEFL